MDAKDPLSVRLQETCRCATHTFNEFRMYQGMQQHASMEALPYPNPQCSNLLRLTRSLFWSGCRGLGNGSPVPSVKTHHARKRDVSMALRSQFHAFSVLGNFQHCLRQRSTTKISGATLVRLGPSCSLQCNIRWLSGNSHVNSATRTAAVMSTQCFRPPLAPNVNEKWTGSRQTEGECSRGQERGQSHE